MSRMTALSRSGVPGEPHVAVERQARPAAGRPGRGRRRGRPACGRRQRVARRRGAGARRGTPPAPRASSASDRRPRAPRLGMWANSSGASAPGRSRRRRPGVGRRRSTVECGTLARRWADRPLPAARCPLSRRLVQIARGLMLRAGRRVWPAEPAVVLRACWPAAGAPAASAGAKTPRRRTARFAAGGEGARRASSCTTRWIWRRAGPG